MGLAMSTVMSVAMKCGLFCHRIVKIKPSGEGFVDCEVEADTALTAKRWAFSAHISVNKTNANVVRSTEVLRLSA